MDNAPLILLAAGGTGGHLFPAEALGVELMHRGYRVRLATDSRALRYSGLFSKDMIDVVPSETVRSRAPWYPPHNKPRNATIVSIDEMPFHNTMVYQNLQADIFLEGDVAHTLKTIVEIVRAAKIDAKAVDERRARCVAGHNKLRESYRAAAVPQNGGISPPMLCQTLGEMLPRTG